MSRPESRVMFGNSTVRWTVALAAFCCSLTVGLLESAAQSGGGGGEAGAATAEQKKEFVRLAKSGKEAYANGDFERASKLFEEAYDIIPRTQLLYRIADAHERAGNPKKAVKFYERYLEEKPGAERRRAIEKSVARLKRKIERRKARQPATVRVEALPEGARVSTMRPAEEAERKDRGWAPVEFEAYRGEIVVTVQKEGYKPTTRHLELQGGELYRMSIELSRAGASGARAGADRRGWGTAPTIAMIVGSVGAIGGGTFYGFGLHCDGNRSKCTRSFRNTSAIMSYIGGGLALAGFGTTFALLLSRNRDAQSAAETSGGPSVGFGLSPTGIHIRGRF